MCTGGAVNADMPSDAAAQSGQSAANLAAMASIFQALGAGKAGGYEADLAGANAKFAKLSARDAIKRGFKASSEKRIEGRRIIGAQRASYAAQGVILDAGSPLDAQMDASRMAELDAIQIRNNAAREAWGFKVQASDYKMKAWIAKKNGQNSAFGSLIGGAADYYEAQEKFGKPATPSGET